MKSIRQSESIHNLIKFLNSKSKPNFKRISKKLRITRQTFQNKFDKLKQKELINNFTININPNIFPKLNYVILEIKTNPKEPYLVEELLKISQLKMLDGIFGEFSLIALFIFKSTEEFNHILTQIDYIMAKSYFKKYQLSETIKVFKTNGIKLSDKKISPRLKFDDKDYLILEILQERQTSKLISTYNMSKLLKAEYNLEMSQATIYNRIKKLEESDVILNYSINFCPVGIGYKGKFLVRIKPKDPSKYDEIALKLEKNHNITDLFRIGEQFGLFAIIRVKEIQNYAFFIRNLYDTGEIEDTSTNFVLDELKPYTNFIIF
ncbi:MAG: Lrp/AsnC ligand binding domain-containing protein [Candidatus Hodarchaeota archaeon]